METAWKKYSKKSMELEWYGDTIQYSDGTAAPHQGADFKMDTGKNNALKGRHVRNP